MNGERAPAEVYKDFRNAVLEILGSLENQEAALNGISGMGKGINDIPGSIVSVETAPSQQKTITESLAENKAKERRRHDDINKVNNDNGDDDDGMSDVEKADDSMGQRVGIANEGLSQDIGETSSNIKTSSTATTATVTNKGYPPIIWVIGGPGSNKASLCLKAVAMNPGWGHIR